MRNKGFKRNKGPQMPGKLLRELGDSGTTGSHAVKRSSSRKEQRKEKRLRSKTSKIRYKGDKYQDNNGDMREKASRRGKKHEGSQEKKRPRQEILSTGGKKAPATPATDGLDTRKKQKQKRPIREEREEDPELVLQRKLAKKLGLKDGKIGKGPGDGLDDILQELDDIMQGDGDEDFGSDVLEEYSSDGLDILGSETDDVASWEQDNVIEENGAFAESEDLDIGGSHDEFERLSEESEQKSEQKEQEEASAGKKYVPPALRNVANTDLDEEQRIIQRKVRGLINRIAETNMKSIVGELSEMYVSEGRSNVSKAISTELVAACTEGPRASERFAIIAATTITAMATITDSQEPIATFVSQLGQALEKSLKDKDSLACSNLVRILGCLYLAGALKADVIFDVLKSWSREFSEEHIVSIAGLLTIAGLSLRKADPQEMKNFVLEIHSIAAEKGDLSVRAKVMLDLVVDVKNNRMKKRQGSLAIPVDGTKPLASALPPQTGLWYKSLSVETVAIGGLSWEKISRVDKKGMWWVPTMADNQARREENVGHVLEQLDNDDELDAVSNAELLKLAEALHMSTDTRKRIFFAVMGSEDAIDATEKLLRLDLKGQQEREIVRVVVECCLHEASWNPYYGLILKRLCKLAKGHRVTLQFCIWDHFKELGKMMVRKISILSKLCAYTVYSGTLSLPLVVKPVEFTGINMEGKVLLHWRVFFRTLFESIESDSQLQSAFEKLIESKDLHGLKKEIKFFLMRKVGPWLASKSCNPGLPDKEQDLLSSLLTKCNKAENFLK